MPQPALAAVVISTSISLFDEAELRRLYRVRKSEFALAVACALGVTLVRTSSTAEDVRFRRPCFTHAHM